jgi:hypothetical protein
MKDMEGYDMERKKLRLTNVFSVTPPLAESLGN